jgi:transcriptional regulator of heat shock response
MTLEEEAISTINHILETIPKEPPIECDYADEWLYENDRMREAFDMAIKALKQKSVLDKIKAEIEKLQTYKMFIGEEETYVERDNVLAIIDKYIVESEPNGKDE